MRCYACVVLDNIVGGLGACLVPCCWVVRVVSIPGLCVLPLRIIVVVG